MYASKDVERITNGLELAYLMCQTIAERSACGDCPLRHNCLEEVPLLTLADDITKGMWSDLAAYADDVESYVSDEDMRAYFDDMASKAERDEYYD